MAYSDTSQVTPPFANPEYDYETQKANIPREQTLWFCSNLAEGSWVPAQYTDNETNHLMPQGWARMLFDGRKFQHAWMVQGQAEEQHFNLVVLKPNGGMNDFSKYVGDGDILNNKLIYFLGTDPAGNYRQSDVGFNGVQASQGEIGWTPEAILASVPGHYKSARFVLEDPDRHKQIPLLEFDLEIFANDEVPTTPSVYRPYISEFERALYRIGSLVDSGQDQLAYMNTMYAAVIKQQLQNMDDTAQAGEKTVNDAVAEGNQKIQDMIKNGNTTVNDFVKNLTALESTNTADLATISEQIKGSNLVTSDNAQMILQQLLDDGKINIGVGNVDNETKLKKMKDELEGNK